MDVDDRVTVLETFTRLASNPRFSRSLVFTILTIPLCENESQIREERTTNLNTISQSVHPIRNRVIILVFEQFVDDPVVYSRRNRSIDARPKKVEITPSLRYSDY